MTPDDLGQERPPGALATPEFFRLASAVMGNDAAGNEPDFDIAAHLASLGGDLEAATYMADQRALRTVLADSTKTKRHGVALWLDGYTAGLRQAKEAK